MVPESGRIPEWEGFNPHPVLAQYASDVQDLYDQFPGKLLDVAQEREAGRFGLRSWWAKSPNPLLSGGDALHDWRTVVPHDISRVSGVAGNGVVDQVSDAVARRQGLRMAANRANAAWSQGDRPEPEDQPGPVQPTGPAGGGGGALGWTRPALHAGRPGEQFSSFLGGGVEDDEAQLLPMKRR